MPQRYTIVVKSSNAIDLLETHKNRYTSENELVSSLAQKILDPLVQRITLAKDEMNETTLCTIVIESDSPDTARTLIYGADFATDRGT